MKILMTTMKMEIGGAETHILELVRELVRRGHSVTVASAGGVFADTLAAEGVRHVEMPLHTKHPLHMMRCYRMLCDLIEQERYDIIHAHARIPGFVVSFAARRFDIPMVTTFHGTFNPVWYLRMLTRVGERTLAVSDDVKDYLMRYYHTPEDIIGITVNGIDTMAFHAASMEERAAVEAELSLPAGTRMMAVSRLDREAAQHIFRLIEAMPAIVKHHPSATLTVVGGGDVLDEVRHAAKAMNELLCADVITVVGPRRDIAHVLAAADIFVGVSRAAMEAMACQIPVVLTGAQGHLGVFEPSLEAEAMQTNFCCRTRAPADAQTLCDAVSDMLSRTPQTWSEMGAYNRSLIERFYSIARMADDAQAMYDTAMKDHPYRRDGILFCGYYGFGNMGDDSLLSAIVANLRKENPHVKLTVMSKNPRETARIYGTDAVNRFSPFAVIGAMRRSKVLIFGGGNLLQDGSSARSLFYYTWILKMAKRCGCKIMVYANGIGPLHLEKSKRAAAEALSLSDIITLREHDSMRECAALGVACDNIRLTADPAFTLKEADTAAVDEICARAGIARDKRYFAVALRDWK
ncbi:MAG: glycosyltransferase, partial [Clostridia bacterium]|nr:glycosyltransferase [Clostridia bacterium]